MRLTVPLSAICVTRADAVRCRSNYHLKCLLKEAGEGAEDGELFNWNKHDKDFFIHLIQTASARIKKYSESVLYCTHSKAYAN
jgi:hypothetical protein